MSSVSESRDGDRSVLERVELPIMTTLSKRDVPLRQAFHLAVRGKLFGEPDIAAVGDADRFGALGGYGPAGIDDVLDKQDVRAPGIPYTFPAGKEAIALDGGVDIDGQPAMVATAISTTSSHGGRCTA